MTACFPIKSLLRAKYWSPVSRVDNAFGDRNLICACPPWEGQDDTQPNEAPRRKAG
jgi:glycine dehydrogenase